MLVLECPVGLHRTIQLQPLQCYGWDIGLDYRDIEWFALETNRDHSVIFETASKYCILESDRMWSTGEGNGKPLQYSCLENPMNSMKRQNNRILNEELPRSVGAQYATGDQWRNSSRKNEKAEPKGKQHPVVDVTGDGSKIQCYKEQHWIGIWNGP